MRPLVLALALALAATASSFAQTVPPRADAMPEEEADLGRAAVLDRLFETLKASKDANRARPIERAIQSIWMRGESDTANLMVSWGMRAMNVDEHEKAVRFFSAAIAQEPEFMEAWNKRATAYFVMKDYPSSLEDIRVVLAMEPRHYGALAGLGIIMRQTGNDAAALGAFRAALEVNPPSGHAGPRDQGARAEGGGAGDLTSSVVPRRRPWPSVPIARQP